MLSREQWAECSQHRLTPHWYLYRQHNAVPLTSGLPFGPQKPGRWMPICMLNPAAVSALQLAPAELLGPFDSYQEARDQIK